MNALNVVIGYSGFAAYESKLLKNPKIEIKDFVEFLETINNIEAVLKKTPEPRFDERFHELERNAYFKELEGFFSLDVNKSKGYRYIYKILYDSDITDINEQYIYKMNVPENTRTKLWQDIAKNEKESNAERFIYIRS